ncbi:PilZ domain-containing protein [Nitrincola iocasae]|jgi:hypothetical protein|uniref:PilZ domain-containing protein n=1 Tax=Nitrincola iocasae TaxID=2614693 RepID=A0A5J6LGS6_9GAMM|nr:PilZ domain-containing protein [Nitrincola iocasae]QEW07506.1 PilZ domain-containing protein [Nitrincola iocasae]
MKPLISFPELKDRGRRAFRMTPVQDDPVSLRVNGDLVDLEDLSANGVAFISEHELKSGRYDAQINFTLDERDFTIFCKLDLIRTLTGTYGGELQEISSMDERLLSRFILECQKQAILRQRAE